MSSNDNYNYNVNINTNTNININGYDMSEVTPDPFNSFGLVDPPDTPFNLFTSRGLFLEDVGGQVQQINSSKVPLTALWIAERYGDYWRFKNSETNRYMGIATLSAENGIPIVTLPSSEVLATRWLIYSITLRSGYHIRNEYSKKVLDVPENLPISGLNIIQYRRKSYLDPSIANQQFYF